MDRPLPRRRIAHHGSTTWSVREQALRKSAASGSRRCWCGPARGFAGRIDGVNVIDSWLSRANGLLVRRDVTSATSLSSPFGKLRDRERYSLKLRSLTPR